MSSWRPKKCKRCGASAEAGVTISKLGYCPPCGVAEAVEAAVSMKERTGPHYERFVASRWPNGPKARALGVVGPSPLPQPDESTAAP